MGDEEKEKFETACMDIIEQLLSTSAEIDKNQAVEKARFLLSYAQAAKNPDPFNIAIYSRVVEEFDKASEEEVQMLKKQIFIKKSN